MMLLKILFVVGVPVDAFRMQGPKVSPKCEEEWMSIQMGGEERFADIMACEEKNQVDKKVIAHLQNGDKSDAISVMEESFQKCAKMSKECAKEIAPVVIQDIQSSGAAVSETCRQAMAKVLDDEKKMKEVDLCDTKGKYKEKVQAAMSKDDLDSAVDIAETSLEKCWGLSEKCAAQVAPVVVQEVETAPPEKRPQPESGKRKSWQSKGTIRILLANGSKNLSLIKAVLDRRNVFQKTNHSSFLQKNEKKVRLDSSLI